MLAERFGSGRWFAEAAVRPAVEGWMPGRSQNSTFIEWGGLLILVVLVFTYYSGLVEFTPISPLLASREGVVDGQLFVPNQKSPLLIFGLSAFFLALRFRRLRDAPERPDTLGLALGLGLLLFGLGIGSWAHYVGDLALEVVSLSFTLLGIAGLLGGSAALGAMRLPALILLLVVPIPSVLLNAIVHPLQLFTASTTSALLDVLGVANVVYGDTIYTQQAAFQVIEGCSGLRAMETLVMTAIVYQALLPHSRVVSWILVLSAPLFGALINQVRVLVIVLDPASSTGQDHTIQGLVMIVAGVLLVTAFSIVLERCLPPDEMPELATPGETVSEPTSRPGRPGRIALVVGLLIVGLGVKSGERFEIERPEHIGPNRLPGTLGAWRAEVEALDYQFLGSTHYAQSVYRTYRNGEESVRVLLGVDARRKPMLSGVSPKIHLLGQGWRIVERWPLEFGEAGTLAYGSIQQSLDQMAYVVSWQQGMDGMLGEILRDLLGLDRSPFQRPYSAMAVQISTPMTSLAPAQRDAARARIEPFLERVRETFPTHAAGGAGEVGAVEAEPSD